MSSTPLQLDPPALVFTPEAASHVATVRIHNPGPEAIALSKVVVRGDDWGGFAITDAHNPKVVPAHAHVEVQLQADARTFVVSYEDENQLEYREGAAALEVHTQSATVEVPLAFETQPTPATSLRVGLLVLWCVIAFASARASQSRPTRVDRRALWIGAALACLGAIPLAGAWCESSLPLAFGELARARCRQGWGGSSITVIDPRFSAWWLLGGLALLLGGPRPLEARLPTLRFVALIGATAFALSFGAQSWDLAAWNYESFAPHPGLGLAALVALAQSRRHHPCRLEALVTSAVFVCLFVGGPSLGPAQALVEGTFTHLGLAVGVFAVKLALVDRAVRAVSETERSLPWSGLTFLALGDLAITLFTA